MIGEWIGKLLGLAGGISAAAAVVMNIGAIQTGLVNVIQGGVDSTVHQVMPGQ